MENVKSYSSGGLGFFPTMFVLFFVLKLADVISWPWLAVCTPLIIQLSLQALAIVLMLTGLILKLVTKK